MFELPKVINIDDKQFKIRNDGDYRMVLDCFAALQDSEIPSDSERVLTALVIFYEDMTDFDDVLLLDNLEVAVKEMYKFFNGGADSTVQGQRVNYKLVDWQKDEQLIASAVNSVAHTEIRALPYVHWWTFLGYYTAIGECPFSNIISIRYKLMAHEKLEKHEQKFKNNNPDYFVWDKTSADEKEAEAWVHEIWNNSGGAT